MEAARRAGALKTDWTEPPEDAWPMGIEWQAKLWRMSNRSVLVGWIGIGSGYYAFQIDAPDDENNSCGAPPVPGPQGVGLTSTSRKLLKTRPISVYSRKRAPR